MTAPPLDDLRVTLARVETKLDTALLRGDDHETRIRRMERMLYLATGFAAAGGGVVGTLVTSVIQSGH